MGDFSYKRYAREYSPALFQFVSPEAFEKLDMMEKDIQPSQATVLTCCEGCAEKHTHTSHHHIVNLGMQNSFFGLPRFLLSLCFWHFWAVWACVFSSFWVTFCRCSRSFPDSWLVARWWQGGQIGFLHGGTSTIKCPPLQREIRWW